MNNNIALANKAINIYKYSTMFYNVYVSTWYLCYGSVMKKMVCTYIASLVSRVLPKGVSRGL